MRGISVLLVLLGLWVAVEATRPTHFSHHKADMSPSPVAVAAGDSSEQDDAFPSALVELVELDRLHAEATRQSARRTTRARQPTGTTTPNAAAASPATGATGVVPANAATPAAGADDENTVKPPESFIGTVWDNIKSKVSNFFKGDFKATPLPGDADAKFMAAARRWAAYAYASYCTPEVIMTWRCKLCKEAPGLQGVFVSSNTDAETQVLIGINHLRKELVVSFRGSATRKNWLWTNAHFWKTQAKGFFANAPQDARIHAGFLTTYKTIQKDLLETIVKHATNFPDYELLIVGHSLGGALAKLCALSFAENQVGARLNTPANVVRRLRLITFGSPRVGNAVWTTYFLKYFPPNNPMDPLSFGMIDGWRTSHLRFVNYKDMVPHLPPRLFNYVHSPREVWLKEEVVNGKTVLRYRICSNEGEDPTCSYSTKGGWSIKDHQTYFDVKPEGPCSPLSEQQWNRAAAAVGITTTPAPGAGMGPDGTTPAPGQQAQSAIPDIPLVAMRDGQLISPVPSSPHSTPSNNGVAVAANTNTATPTPSHAL